MSKPVQPQSRKKLTPRSALWTAAIVLVLLVIYLAAGGSLEALLQGESAPEAAADSMILRFLDVGQGSSTLISMGDTHVLIDAGENDQGETVLAELEAAGVKRLALAVGSHPHSDHIGGMDTVLESMSTDAYWMPDLEHTSRTFTDVLDVLEQKNIPVTLAKAGDMLELGGIRLWVLSPAEITGDMNNASLVIRAVSAYGSVLVPGDAEKPMEEAMLKSGQTLSADVLQLSHHGSSTSNTEAFLRAVHPSWAVIPVGADNDYGHPHKEIIALLRKLSLPYYRTDEDGTITCVMNASGITFSTEK